LFEVYGETATYCIIPILHASDFSVLQKAKQVLCYWAKKAIQGHETGWCQNQEQHLILLVPS